MTTIGEPSLHLMLTTDAVGGVWRYSLQLSRALAAHNVAVTMVCVGRSPDSEQQAEIASIPNLRRLHLIPGKLEWEQDSAAEIVAARQQLASIVAEEQPDLLHTNQFCFGDLPTACPRLVVGHSDILSWREWCADDYTAPSWLAFLAYYQRLVEAGLRGAQAVVAPSHFMAGCLQKHYAFATTPQVIANGINIKPATAVKERIAIVAGRLWDKAKNVGIMVEALKSLPSSSYQATANLLVLLAGEGDVTGTGTAVKLNDSLPRLRPRNDGAIQYLGYLDTEHLYQQLARASIYLAVSRYEPFGLAVVEGALHGCAVLANDIPTFREVWGDDAVYFTHNSPASLRSRLSWLLTHPQQLADYGERARARSARLYNANTMAAAYNLLYRSTVQHRDGG